MKFKVGDSVMLQGIDSVGIIIDNNYYFGTFETSEIYCRVKWKNSSIYVYNERYLERCIDRETIATSFKREYKNE